MFEGSAVDEADFGRDGFAALEVCDVEPFDAADLGGDVERSREGLASLDGIDVADFCFGLPLIRGRGAVVDLLHRFDLIPQCRGSLEVHLLRCFDHFFLQLADHRRAFGFEEAREASDVLAVAIFGDRFVARRGALADGCEQAGAEELVLGIALDDVQRAGAELENGLERVNCCS